MKILLFFTLLVAIIAGGCIPGNRRIRKAGRKITRARQLAPELFSNDTVIIHDTITIERFRVDTNTTIIYHDSVTVLNNERVVLRYYYDTLRQEIHHEVECKEITKEIETRFITEKIRPLTFFEKLDGFVVYMVGLLMLAFFYIWMKSER